MSSYVFSDDCLRSLAFHLNEACDIARTGYREQVLNTPSRSVPDFSYKQYTLTPWNYYFFSWQCCCVSIDYVSGSNFFCLICTGFVPPILSRTYDSTNNLYGNFKSFDAALDSFKSVCFYLIKEYDYDGMFDSISSRT